MRLHLFAPAKVNWTLEVLGRREDGFRQFIESRGTCQAILSRLQKRRGDRGMILLGPLLIRFTGRRKLFNFT